MKQIYYILSIITLTSFLSGCSLFKGNGPGPGGGDGPQGGGGGPCQRCAEREAGDRQRELDQQQAQNNVAEGPPVQQGVLEEPGNRAGRGPNDAVQTESIDPSAQESNRASTPDDTKVSNSPTGAADEAAPAFDERGSSAPERNSPRQPASSSDSTHR